MIRFTEIDNGKQFISIVVEDNTPTENIIKHIKNTYSALHKINIISDSSEILIEIDNSIYYGFSLNELRANIKSIANTTITHFSVDTEETNQRYYG